jgi:psiF repeat
MPTRGGRSNHEADHRDRCNAGVFVVSTAHAADEKKPTAQQEKMKSCNAQATEKALKGDERKAFMSECLKAKPMTQQEKMTACNKEASAKNLKGDDRKAFMSDCLKAEKKS